ncbi:hypothetical protein [Streptomyces nigrescens]|nr:hypothetical protein [Streptomyces nigrescens]
MADLVGGDARLGAQLREVEEEPLAGDQAVSEGELEEYRQFGAP